MDPGHKARKNPSDNADVGFQAVGPALQIIQLNIEWLSAAKRHIILMHTRRRWKKRDGLNCMFKTIVVLYFVILVTLQSADKMWYLLSCQIY